jgi:hypothetical protein
MYLLAAKTCPVSYANTAIPHGQRSGIGIKEREETSIRITDTDTGKKKRYYGFSKRTNKGKPSLNFKTVDAIY